MPPRYAVTQRTCLSSWAHIVWLLHAGYSSQAAWRGGIWGHISPGENPKTSSACPEAEAGNSSHLECHSRQGRQRKKRIQEGSESTRRANGGHEPGVGKATWCRVRLGGHCCWCPPYAQSSTFSTGYGILQGSRQLVPSLCP